MKAIVHYQIATYSGIETVYYSDPNDDNDHIIYKAKAQLRRKYGYFPYGLQSFKVERCDK
jgi:hypothetical protein